MRSFAMFSPSLAGETERGLWKNKRFFGKSPRPGQRAGYQRREIDLGKFQPFRRGLYRFGRLDLGLVRSLGIGGFLQLRHKMPLAAVRRPDTAAAACRKPGRGAVFLSRAAKAAAGQVAEGKLRVPRKEGCDLRLVLSRGKGAGRVDQHAARGQQGRGIF